MVARKRKTPRKVFDKSLVKCSNHWYFLNGELVKVLKQDIGSNLVVLYNPEKNIRQMAPRKEFLSKRERAYTPKHAARLLDRSYRHIYKLMREGKIPITHGTLPYGERRFQSLAFYSESEILGMRDYFATVHRGSPRKDGLITTNIISEQELRWRMGTGMMLYVQNSDGEYVPIWSETIN